jgi:hypothetical protein
MYLCCTLWHLPGIAAAAPTRATSPKALSLDDFTPEDPKTTEEAPPGQAQAESIIKFIHALGASPDQATRFQTTGSKPRFLSAKQANDPLV